MTTKLRRGVGAEKKKATPKKEYKKKEKAPKRDSIEAHVSAVSGTRMKTRGIQRKEIAETTEPELAPTVKERVIESHEPAITKGNFRFEERLIDFNFILVIKTEDQGRIGQIPVLKPEVGLPLKGLPIGTMGMQMQMPINDPTKEQQLLLAQLNYLMASGSYSLQRPLSTPPLALKTPSIEDLLRIGRPNVLPTGLGGSNHLMLRNSWTSTPFIGNVGNPLLFSNNFRNPMGNFK